ncbi:hypothetical protein [Clostridium sp. 001]|nr:hypothetical protein [Clostridium sp. 001]
MAKKLDNRDILIKQQQLLKKIDFLAEDVIKIEKHNNGNNIE